MRLRELTAFLNLHNEEKMPSLLADAAKEDPHLCDKNSRAILATMTSERIANAAMEDEKVRKGLKYAAKNMSDPILFRRINAALERCQALS